MKHLSHGPYSSTCARPFYISRLLHPPPPTRPSSTTLFRQTLAPFGTGPPSFPPTASPHALAASLAHARSAPPRATASLLSGLSHTAEASRESFTLLREEAGRARPAPCSISALYFKHRPRLTAEALFDGAQCRLCGEPLRHVEDFALHAVWGKHRLSENLFCLVMEYHGGRSAYSLLEEWVYAVLVRGPGGTLPAGVAVNLQELCGRFRKIAGLLKDQGVLRHSVDYSTGRSFEFDQAEWVGDLVIPTVLWDMVSNAFDTQTEGISAFNSLGPLIGVLYGNPHLEFTYDFARLDLLVADAHKVMSKGKSDVVEAMVGELEIFLWGCQVNVSSSVMPAPPTEDHQHLASLATHCRNLLVALVLLSYLGPTTERIVALRQKLRGEIPLASLVGPQPYIARCLPSLQNSRRIPERPPKEGLDLPGNPYGNTSKTYEGVPKSRGFVPVVFRPDTVEEPSGQVFSSSCVSHEDENSAAPSSTRDKPDGTKFRTAPHGARIPHPSFHELSYREVALSWLEHRIEILPPLWSSSGE